jgi:magnesium-transporting ATPase (P-type)
MEIAENIRNHQELRDVASYKCLIVVIRENKEQVIQSDELVPGDLVIIP